MIDERVSAPARLMFSGYDETLMPVEIRLNIGYIFLIMPQLNVSL